MKKLISSILMTLGVGDKHCANGTMFITLKFALQTLLLNAHSHFIANVRKKKNRKLIFSIFLFLGVLTMANAKSMVIYFSRADENYSVRTITEGNTAKVAKIIAAETGSDIWEIKPVNDYPANYNDCINVAQKEQQGKARPAFIGNIPDLSGYDTLYLGSPNWWGDFPMIVYTFLEKANLEGKTFRLFVTHEGSGSGGLESSLKKAEPKAKVTKSLAIRRTTAQNDKAATEKAVKGWL